METENDRVQENRYDAENLRFELLEKGRRTSFVYHNGELLHEEGREEQETSYHLGVGIDAFQRGQELFYCHRDEQLSMALITGGQGEIQNSYQYDAFGAQLEGKEQFHNRIRYTGQQYDELTEQYYLRARYYNPVLGRFMQEDVYQGDGLNLYAYCGNNPVVYWDPSGYASKKSGSTGCTAPQEMDDGGNTDTPKRMNVSDSGHHVPAVRKSQGRPFEVDRSDKTRPTIFPIGNDPGHDHWRLHDAEREYVGPRQGDFIGTADELFDAYKEAYKGLDDIKVDVKSPNGTYVLGKDVTPYEAVRLIQEWLIEHGIY